MSLASLLHDLPVWSPVGFPPEKNEIIILSAHEDIRHLPQIFPQDTYKVRLVISDAQTGYNFSEILQYPAALIVIFCSRQNFPLLNYFYTQLEGLHIRHAYICMPVQRSFSSSSLHAPEFLDRYRKEIEAVHSLLEDDESRRIFAARVKSIITGNIGYIMQSDHPQYFHPATFPRPGDVMLDGGVSGNIAVERKFSELVGAAGHIFAFEPEPGCIAQASEQVRHIENITLLPYGLSNTRERVALTSEGPGSRVVRNGVPDNCVLCDMVSIDAFVEEQKVQKVDIIKLDVEGSEESALLGGMDTIKKHRPKLMISLYHKYNDMFELPLFINSLDCNYKCYMGHYRPQLQETVLYAIAGNNILREAGHAARLESAYGKRRECYRHVGQGQQRHHAGRRGSGQGRSRQRRPG